MLHLIRPDRLQNGLSLCMGLGIFWHLGGHFPPTAEVRDRYLAFLSITTNNTFLKIGMTQLSSANSSRNMDTQLGDFRRSQINFHRVKCCSEGLLIKSASLTDNAKTSFKIASPASCGSIFKTRAGETPCVNQRYLQTHRGAAISAEGLHY